MKKKNPNAVALGRLGGKARAEALTAEQVTRISQKGGKARAASMTPEERKALARKAVMTRWEKRK